MENKIRVITVKRKKKSHQSKLFGRNSIQSINDKLNERKKLIMEKNCSNSLSNENFLLFMKLKLKNKYNTTSTKYNIYKINQILTGAKSKIFIRYNEFNQFNNKNEYLLRFYKSGEIKLILPELVILYELYYKNFPTYIGLFEAKYMFLNILLKRKENLYKFPFDCHKSNIERNKNDGKKIFNENVLDLIYDYHNNNDNEYLKELISMESNKNSKIEKNAKIIKLIDTIEKIECESKKSKITIVEDSKNNNHDERQDKKNILKNKKNFIFKPTKYAHTINDKNSNKKNKIKINRTKEYFDKYFKSGGIFYYPKKVKINNLDAIRLKKYKLKKNLSINIFSFSKRKESKILNLTNNISQIIKHHNSNNNYISLRKKKTRCLKINKNFIYNSFIKNKVFPIKFNTLTSNENNNLCSSDFNSNNNKSINFTNNSNHNSSKIHSDSLNNNNGLKNLFLIDKSSKKLKKAKKIKTLNIKSIQKVKHYRIKSDNKYHKISNILNILKFNKLYREKVKNAIRSSHGSNYRSLKIKNNFKFKIKNLSVKKSNSIPNSLTENTKNIYSKSDKRKLKKPKIKNEISFCSLSKLICKSNRTLISKGIKRKIFN